LLQKVFFKDTKKAASHPCHRISHHYNKTNLGTTKLYPLSKSGGYFFVIFSRKYKSRDFSQFIVPADAPGITRTKIRGKLGIRASDPAENVL
jgi:hypothetical protein